MPKTTLDELKKGIVKSGLTQLDGRLDDDAREWLRKLGNGVEEDPKNLMPMDPTAVKESQLFTSQCEEFPGKFPTFRSFLIECTKQHPENLERALGEDDPEAGGFLVPEPMAGVLWIDTLGSSVIFNRVRREKMTSNVQLFPVVIDEDHSSNLFGGLKFRTIAEKAVKGETEPKVGQIKLESHVLYALTSITNQLLSDSKGMAEKMLRQMYTGGVAWEIDRQIFRGLGTGGNLLGILSSGALITVSKESGQSAGTLVYENCLSMYEKLIPSLESKAVWYFSPSCKKALMSFNLAIGTGGSMAVVASGDSVAPVPKTLFGIPIVFTEHCSPIGIVGDVILACGPAYLLGVRSPLAIKMNPWSDTAWTKNLTSMRGEIRIAGQSQLDKKLKLRDGVTEVSPWIVTEERS
ncbi:hypothetical protein ES703_19051 [subsurface metagenome]